MGINTIEKDDNLREDTRDFKYKLEHLHAIVKNDNPWKNESDMIEELAIDRRKRYDTSRNV